MLLTPVLGIKRKVEVAVQQQLDLLLQRWGMIGSLQLKKAGRFPQACSKTGTRMGEKYPILYKI
ncbi:hypothetical protein [Pseudomonas sp. S3_C01]